MIEFWKLSRSTQYFVYSALTLSLFTTCLGQTQLAEFLEVHVNTARRALTSQLYNGYILSTVALTTSQLQAILAVGQSVNRRLTKSVYVYNASQTVLLHVSSTVNAFMVLSGLNGAAVKQLALSPTLLWRDTHFISYELIDTADNSMSNVPPFVPAPSLAKEAKPVFGLPVDGGPSVRWTSLRECVKVLTGNRNTNTKSLELRIKHGEPYLGYYVSFKPFSNS